MTSPILTKIFRAMTHDETIYSDPDSFIPERFFTPDGKLNDDDTILAFGFGRRQIRSLRMVAFRSYLPNRICPGRHMADATVWLEIASVLAAFDITKAKDDAGMDIEIPGLYSDGFVRYACVRF